MKVATMISLCVCLALSGLFGYISYIRYWKYAEEIDQAGSSYISPDGANLISGGVIWTLPFLIFGLVAIGLVGVLLMQALKSRTN